MDAARVQGLAKFVRQFFAVLTFDEQESRIFVGGLRVQLLHIMTALFKHGSGPGLDKGKTSSYRGLADHPDEHQFRIQTCIWRLRLHRLSSSSSFICRECTEYRIGSQALCQLTQAVPTDRSPGRKTSGQLSRHGHHRDDPSLAVMSLLRMGAGVPLLTLSVLASPDLGTGLGCICGVPSSRGRTKSCNTSIRVSQ